MRLHTPRYPVDRYLVESSKTMDVDKLIDELCKPEPTLGLEDEIMLRKLHEMLQSTADDLRMLSAELSKYHEPRVQVKTMPTPLDEEYNEQMHIDEIVDAKFRGLEPSSSQTTVTPQNISKIVHEIVANKIKNVKPIIESVIQKPTKQVQSKPLNKLSMSRTKILQIAENKDERNNYNSESTKTSQAPKKSKEDRTVYKEIVHEYIQPKKESLVTNSFNIQKMPSINIRSELRTQNVLQLDILPENKEMLSTSENKNNVAVISVTHELPCTSQEIHEKKITIEQPPVRKVFKMVSYESSESSNNNISEDKQTNYKPKPTHKTLDRRKDSKIQFINTDSPKKDSKRPRSNINDWKKKLNTIYGQSTRTLKSSSKNTSANSKKETLQVPVAVNQPDKSSLNNTEYIPYTKLTLGGVKVKDIERELPQVSKNRDVPLSPILDRILSRQNSFSNGKSINKDEKILTTSDENLLQEVLDIEEKVISTLSKNKNSNNTLSPQELSNNEDDNTYADDFEIDNSEPSSAKSESAPIKSDSPEISINLNINNINDRITTEPGESNDNVNNTTYVKVSNLSFKNQIDTFEFIHTIDRQDNATQSNSVNKISLKETQTSPRNDNDNIQTIRNDLSIDPRQEIENMFKIEKDFIKKLIIDEYSDLIEKNVNKPSTSYDSKTYSDEKNVSTIQKNTQTSPARVKNVMTSPTHTKTRTTSPFGLSVTVHKQTSPMIVVTNNEKDSALDIQPTDSKVTIEDQNLTINLSSPRFSLRLPQSSCDLSHSDRHSRNKKLVKPKPFRVPSSSSSKEDYSSSDISFGEIKREFKRRLRRHKIPSISEPSSSSLSKYSDHSSYVAPMRSEGEISVCQTRSNKYSKSEGEISLGQVKKH